MNELGPHVFVERIPAKRSHGNIFDLIAELRKVNPLMSIELILESYFTTDIASRVI